MVQLQAAPSNQNGFIRLNLADFPELLQNRGSVRISTSSLDARTNKQLGLFAPVIINRADSGGYYAMSAACTHEDCVVRRLDKTSNRMVCPCHGSQYLPDGTVFQGPAQQPLRRFLLTQSPDSLVIEMPDVFYEMNVEKAGESSRLKISFLAFESLKYEIYFRESLESTTLTRVNFSTTATGSLDQTEIAVPGDFATVFVERPGRFGFFEIAMKTQKV